MRRARSPWEHSGGRSVVAGRDAAPAEMGDAGLWVKPHLKTTSEFHSVALKWKHHVPVTTVLSRRHGGSAAGLRHTRTPHPAPEEGWCWGDMASPAPILSPSLVSKQECLNAFYVVTQMMKDLKMGLTKTSCTSE